MKRKILFCIVIMLLTGIVLAQASSVAEGIVSAAGNYDARVKLRETPGGKVIGQYAQEIGDTRRPFAVETWEKAYEIWNSSL